MRITDLSSFNSVHESGLAKLLPSRPRIAIGMGTCGSGNGAEGVYHAFASGVDRRGLGFHIARVGCFGFCAEEPLVNVWLPGKPLVILHRIQVNDVDAILDDLARGRMPVELALCKIEEWDHVTGHITYGAGYPEIPVWNEVPFFRGQRKIVLRNCGIISPADIDEYLAVGGYAALYKVLIDGNPEAVIEQVKASKLRGRGGAGYLTGIKWEYLRQAKSDQKYIICNADEGDPGAYMNRIEGHAKITIRLDDSGKVSGTDFHVTQVRGFEKFTEGRPFYEMPSITARICGICPISHLLASVKACDAIMAVQIPETAAKLRELLHCGQFVQSHALSFFHLSAPDILLGMDSDPARRNIVGLIEKHPDLAKDGIALRKFGQQVIERLAKERIHPSWTVPGGVNAPLTPDMRDRILSDLPIAKAIARRALKHFKGVLDKFSQEIEHFGNSPTMYAGLVDARGRLQFYDGIVRFKNADGATVADLDRPRKYQEYIGEASLPMTYLKAPYFKPLGYPTGIYRVGPLARLNVADSCGTPEADAELEDYRQRFGRTVQSAFLYHYARLIEALYALGRMETLLEDPEILDTRVRAEAGVNALEGIGIAEEPRGILIHHYKVDAKGAIKWANLIIATGHNNLAIGRGISQVSRHFIDGKKLQEGMLNRVSALVRAYDPCLSCSTHADGTIPLRVELLGPDGSILDQLSTERH